MSIQPNEVAAGAREETRAALGLDVKVGGKAPAALATGLI